MKISVSNLIAAYFLLCFGSLTFAQNSQLTGLVKDRTDAVVPAAAVTLTNVETGAVLNAKSSKAGFYVFASIVPGRYSLAGDAPGFAKTVINNVKIDAAANVSQDIVLQVQSSSQSVNVVSDPPSELTETTAAVSTVISRTEIENMPLNGNSLQTLFELSPGIVTNAGGSPDQGGGFSVNGQRPTSNYLTVDGASQNIYMPANLGAANATGAGIPVSASGGTNGLLPVDAVEEFRLQTSSYSAQYGRTPGGQIEVKTRGGTNQFHGSLFENFRNNVMDAGDWFIGYDNAVLGTSLKQPPLRMNDFGGTFGGPILKNRLFFFFSHESLVLDQPQPAATTSVPDLRTRQETFSSLQPVLAGFPQGNAGVCSSCATPSDLYVYANSNQIVDHSTSLRLDFTPVKNVHTFFRTNEAPSHLVSPAIQVNNTNINIMTATAGIVAQLSSRATADVTANFSKTNTSQTFWINAIGGNDPTQFTTAVRALLPGSSTFAFYDFNDGWPSLSFGPSNHSHLSQWNLAGSVSWLFGKHSFRAGIDFLRHGPVESQPNLVQLDPLSLASLQTGVSDYVQYVTYISFPNIHIANTSLFAQDSYRVSQNLTLDYGLRWEFNPAPSASSPGLPVLLGDPTQPASLSAILSTTGIYKNRYTNFAPRVGFAYALGGNNGYGTVFRGGVGIFFDTGQAATAAQAVQGQYPYRSYVLQTNVPFGATQWSNPPISVSTLPQSSLYLTDPRLQAPRTYEWSLVADQSLGRTTTFTVGYVGNDGEKLVAASTYYGNAQQLAQILNLYTNRSHSDYQAMQAQVTSKIGSRFQARASYTYSHALDNSSTDFNSVGASARSPLTNSDNDIRHMFSTAIHYSPNGIVGNRLLHAMTTGWSIDTVALLQSASPLSVDALVTGAINLTQYNELADIVLGVPAIINDPTAPGGKRLNPAAFTTPPGTRDGTSERNNFRLFGLTQWDFSMSRSWRFPLREAATIMFRVDAYNIVNITNFSNVNNFYDPGNLTLFGEATQTYASYYGAGGALPGGGALNPAFSNGGARSLQLSIKVKF